MQKSLNALEDLNALEEWGDRDAQARTDHPLPRGLLAEAEEDYAGASGSRLTALEIFVTLNEQHSGSIALSSINCL